MTPQGKCVKEKIEQGKKAHHLECCLNIEGVKYTPPPRWDGGSEGELLEGERARWYENARLVGNIVDIVHVLGLHVQVGPPWDVLSGTRVQLWVPTGPYTVDMAVWGCTSR